MITETMTIHEALSELKMLDKRIQQKINRTSFCTVNKHSNSKIDGKPIREYMDDVASAHSSICDLIRRRAAIRNALSISNSKTIVSIGGIEYTVAEAIEMKNTGVKNYEYLLATMSRQFSDCTSKITRENGETLRERADNYIVSMFGGKDRTANNDDIEAARRQYMENNTLDLIDPVGVKAQIDELESFVEKFKAEVDSKISISNATTMIEVKY